MSFDRYNQRISIWGSRMQRKLKNWTDKKFQKKIKEGTSKPNPKNAVLWIKQPEKFEQQVTPPIQILIWTYHNGVKQAVANMKILECVSVGEKLMLIL